MPFALLAIGLLLVIAAYNNTQGVLSSQLQKDFTGKTGFIYWIAAIVIVGAIGYIKPMQTVSRAMLALVLVMIFLTRKGVFQQFNAALSGGAGTGANGETTTTPLPEPDAPLPKSRSSSSSSSSTENGTSDAMLDPEYQKQLNASNWGSEASGAEPPEGLLMVSGTRPDEREDGVWVITQSFAPTDPSSESGAGPGKDLFKFIAYSNMQPKGNTLK